MPGPSGRRPIEGAPSRRRIVGVAGHGGDGAINDYATAGADIDEDDRQFIGKAMGALRRGHYQLALELFAKVLLIHKGDSERCLHAWEGRATCYERMGDLVAAQNEALLMINSQPRAARGYLRLGKILRLRRRKTDALRIYRQGASRTGGHLEIRRQIEIVEGQLTKEQQINGPVDLFRALPAEVILRVLKYMPWDTAEELFKCSKVALHFRSAHFGSTISIRPGATAPNIRRHWQRHQKHTHHIHHSVSTLWERLTGKDYPWTRLQSLTLEGIIDFDAAKLVPSFASLTQLRLHHCRVSSAQEVRRIVKVLVCLRKLELRQIDLADGLSSLEGMCMPARISTVLVTSRVDPLQGKVILEQGRLRCVRSTGIILSERELTDFFTTHSESGSDGGTMPLPFLFVLCTVPNLGLLLEFLSQRWPDLTELGIVSVSCPTPLSPQKVVEAFLTSGNNRRILCLPFLGPLLGHTEQEALGRQYPQCRLIFDPILTHRLATRRATLFP